MDSTEQDKTVDLAEQAGQHFEKGDYTQCLETCRQVLETAPEDTSVLLLAGIASIRLDSHVQARAYLTKVIEINPDDRGAPLFLADIDEKEGNLDDALRAYQQVLSNQPNCAPAHTGIGNIRLREGDIDGALSSFARATTFDPTHAPGFSRFGVALQLSGSPEDAVGQFRKALELNPNDKSTQFLLARALCESNNVAESIEVHQQLIADNPEDSNAHNSLGLTYNRLKKYVLAVRAFEAAHKIDPAAIQSTTNLATTLHNIGFVKRATVLLAQLLKHHPDSPSIYSNFLLLLHYTDEQTAEQLATMHRRWGQKLASSAPAARPHTRTAPQHKRLKVGFVSADLRNHPVGYFIRGLFENYDRETFEFVCYSDVHNPDETTEALKKLVDSWVECGGVSNEELDKLIRESQIDILVDCAGHTAKNRLPMFARKPAPIQITAFGHINTTGLNTIDYLVTDHHHSPPGSESLFTEELVRMPNGYICYSPPSYAPEVGPLPADENGYITFGCFNKLAKLTRTTLALWAKVMMAVEGSKLLIKTFGLDSPDLARNYLDNLEQAGISAQRVTLSGGAAHSHLLATYQGVDIALDTLPYAGGLTTCEALWMGVPVITKAGDRFTGRHSVSHLSNTGIPEFIADTDEAYVEIAKRWSLDLNGLRSLRQSLRQKVSSSPLYDGEKYARDFEEFLTRAWQRWCSKT